MTSRTKLRSVMNLALAAALAASTGFAVGQQGYNRNGSDHPDQRDDHRGDRGDDRRDNNNQPDFHFQDQHRAAFQQHYQSDADHWRNRSDRPQFQRGQALPRNVVVRTVPSSYYGGAPAPPPGYRYGYTGGYVVSYNPTTRIVADVLDLATRR